MTKHSKDFYERERERTHQAFAALRSAPYHTAETLSAALKISKPTVRALLVRMMQSYASVYCWESPNTRRKNRSGAREIRYSIALEKRRAHIDRILVAIVDTSMTTSELAPIIGIAEPTVSGIMNDLHAQERVRVDWYRQVSTGFGHALARVWSSSPGDDAEKPSIAAVRPPDLSVATDDELVEISDAEAAMLNRKAAPFVPRRDPLVAAFYGAA